MSTIRSLVVSIGVDNSKLAKGMKQGKGEVDRFTLSVGRSGEAIRGLIKDWLTWEAGVKAAKWTLREYTQALERIGKQGSGVLDKKQIEDVKKLSGAFKELGQTIDETFELSSAGWASKLAKPLEALEDKYRSLIGLQAKFRGGSFTEVQMNESGLSDTGRGLMKLYDLLKSGGDLAKETARGAVLDAELSLLRQAAKEQQMAAWDLQKAAAAELERAERLRKVDERMEAIRGRFDRAKSIVDETRTDDERLRAGLDEVKDLVRRGTLEDFDAAERRVRQLVDMYGPREMVATRPSVASNQALVAGSQAVFAAMARFQAGEQFGNTPQKQQLEVERKALEELRSIRRSLEQPEESVQI